MSIICKVPTHIFFSSFLVTVLNLRTEDGQVKWGWGCLEHIPCPPLDNDLMHQERLTRWMRGGWWRAFTLHMVYPRQGEPLHLCYYLTFLFFTNSQIKHCKSPCNAGFDQTSVMNVCACACVSARVCACASTRHKTIKPTILFSRLSIMPSTASNVLFKPIFPPSPFCTQII